MHVIGDVEGRGCLILDDEISTAGTIVAAVNALRQHGARRSHHQLLPPGAQRARGRAAARRWMRAKSW